MLFNRVQRAGLEFFLVDHLDGFLVSKQPHGILNLEFPGFCAGAAHILEHALQLRGHFFHPWWGHDFDANWHRLNLDLDFLIVQFSFAQHFAEFLPGLIVPVVRLADRGKANSGRRGWQQGVQDAFLCSVLCPMTNFCHFLFAGQLDGDIHQVTNDAINLAADVADFGKLGCLDFDKRRFSQFGQTSRYFSLADTGRSNHQDVLWRNFAAERFVDLYPAPAIPEGDSDGALGVVLADDVLVQFLDDFSGCHL